MEPAAEDPELHELGPTRAAARAEILAGLTATPKRLSPKYFYDQRGSELFDEICDQPEYYPTRTEISILEANAGEIAAALGPRGLIIEPGSGSSLKTRLLLDALEDPVAYAPVEISREHLQAAAAAINTAYPALEVLPVHADFTRPFTVPAPKREPDYKVIYFPGSTIGNFEPEQAAALLKQWRGLLSTRCSLLIGVDLVKPAAGLNAAYNDRAGVTARFNLNVLSHINRLADGNFDPGRFRHKAFYNEALGRIEMHLVSKVDQLVSIGGRQIPFAAGEGIHTENSHKFTLQQFAGLAGGAGYRVDRVWTDARRWFSVQLLRAC